MSSDINGFGKDSQSDCTNYKYEPNNDDNILQTLLVSLLSGIIDEQIDCKQFKTMSENVSLWEKIQKDMSVYGFNYSAQYLHKKWKDMLKCTQERKLMSKLHPKTIKYRMSNLDLEINYYFKELVNDGLFAPRSQISLPSNDNLIEDDDVVIIKDHDENISDTMKNDVCPTNDTLENDSNNRVCTLNTLDDINELDGKSRLIDHESTIDIFDNDLIKFEEDVNVVNDLNNEIKKEETQIPKTVCDKTDDVEEFSSEDEIALIRFVRKKKEVKFRKIPGLEGLPDNHWTKWWKNLKVPEEIIDVTPKDDPNERRRARIRERKKEAKLEKKSRKIEKKRGRRKKNWKPPNEEINGEYDSKISSSTTDHLTIGTKTEKVRNEDDLSNSSASQDSDCIDVSKMEADIAANYLQTCLLQNFNNSIA